MMMPMMLSDREIIDGDGDIQSPRRDHVRQKSVPLNARGEQNPDVDPLFGLKCKVMQRFHTECLADQSWDGPSSRWIDHQVEKAETKSDGSLGLSKGHETCRSDSVDFIVSGTTTNSQEELSGNDSAFKIDRKRTGDDLASSASKGGGDPGTCSEKQCADEESWSFLDALGITSPPLFTDSRAESAAEENERLKARVRFLRDQLEHRKRRKGELEHMLARMELEAKKQTIREIDR